MKNQGWQEDGQPEYSDFNSGFSFCTQLGTDIIYKRKYNFKPNHILLLYIQTEQQSTLQSIHKELKYIENQHPAVRRQLDIMIRTKYTHRAETTTQCNISGYFKYELVTMTNKQL